MRQLTWKPQVRGLACGESPDSFHRLLQGTLSPFSAASLLLSAETLSRPWPRFQLSPKHVCKEAPDSHCSQPFSWWQLVGEGLLAWDDSRPGWLASGSSCSCCVSLSKPLLLSGPPGRWPGAPDLSSIWNPIEGVVFTTVPHDDAPGQLTFS